MENIIHAHHTLSNFRRLENKNLSGYRYPVTNKLRVYCILLYCIELYCIELYRYFGVEEEQLSALRSLKGSVLGVLRYFILCYLLLLV